MILTHDATALTKRLTFLGEVVDKTLEEVARAPVQEGVLWLRHGLAGGELALSEPDIDELIADAG